MVSSDAGNLQTGNQSQDYQRQTSETQKRKGLENRTYKKLDILTADLVNNIEQIPWVTKAEFQGDKIIYHINKKRRTENKRKCEALKTGFRVLLEREFGNREDLAANLIYRTEDEQKGVYSIQLEILAKDEDKALYEVASKLNERLENYLESIR